MRNFKTKTEKNERGATSVLVIFMVIVLVTLGAFSIAAANVNLRFARKATLWNSVYYKLDGQGEIYAFVTNRLLGDSEYKALKYLTDKLYTRETSSDIPNNIQKKLYDTFRGEALSEEFLTEAFGTVFMFYASNDLTKLASDYASNKVSFLTDADGGIYELATSVTFISEENPDCNLDVELLITAPKYNFSTDGQNFTHEKLPESSSFDITRWTERQIQSGDSGEIKLWDGNIEH